MVEAETARQQAEIDGSWDKIKHFYAAKGGVHEKTLITYLNPTHLRCFSPDPDLGVEGGGYQRSCFYLSVLSFWRSDLNPYTHEMRQINFSVDRWR